MKKNIVLMILLLFPFTISAETYYSDYGDYSDYSMDKVIANDVTDVEVERRYKWYKEEKILGDYYLQGNNDLSYPYMDINDYKITSYSNWSTSYPLENIDRYIESKQVYKYQDMKEIRYIEFSNVSGSYGAFRVSEINITAGNSNINYTVSCTSCSANFEHYLKNSVVYESMAYVNNGGKFIIDLNNYYPLDSINIKLYMYDEGTSDKRYNLSIYRDKDSNIYAEVLNIHYFTYDGLNEIVPFNININNVRISNPEWYAVKESNTVIEQSKTRQVWNEYQYRYQDKIYRYYNLKKEYLDSYSSHALDNFINKEIDDYKDFYRYRIRDKIEIADKIIILSKEDLIENFILSTTINNINIESNINYNKNGKYQATFKLPFIDVTRDVTVNIEQNTIDQYQKIIYELNNEINNLMLINNQLNNEYNKQEKELTDLINSLENEIKINQNQITELNNQISQLDQDNSKQVGQILKYQEEINKLNEIISHNKQTIGDLENYIVEINNNFLTKSKEANTLKNQKIINENDYNNTIIELQKEIDKYKSINNSYINSIEKCQNKLMSLEEIKNNIEIPNNVSEDNNKIKKAGLDNRYFLIPFSIFILLFILRLIFKRHKKSN